MTKPLLTSNPYIKHNTNKRFFDLFMKHSLFLLASLVFTSALYAQTETSLFTREQVLDIFTQYNPALLEKAQQTQEYQVLLDEFIKTFQVPDTPQGRFTLIAAVRNFDNSVRLHALTERYIEQAAWARMAAQDDSGIQSSYRKGVQDTMTGIYAVTLQMNRWELQEMKRALKQVKKDEVLSSEQKKEQIAVLKKKIKQQKENVQAIEKNAGEMVLSFTDQQLVQADTQVEKRLISLQQGAAQESSAKQASNLQVKTNHKKPVAK